MEKATLIKTIAIAAGLTSCAIVIYTMYFRDKDDIDKEEKKEH